MADVSFLLLSCYEKWPHIRQPAFNSSLVLCRDSRCHMSCFCNSVLRVHSGTSKPTYHLSHCLWVGSQVGDMQMACGLQPIFHISMPYITHLVLKFICRTPRAFLCFLDIGEKEQDLVVGSGLRHKFQSIPGIRSFSIIGIKPDPSPE